MIRHMPGSLPIGKLSNCAPSGSTSTSLPRSVNRELLAAAHSTLAHAIRIEAK
jgi:hypothetical protein